MQKQGNQFERPSTLRLVFWESRLALRSGGVQISLTVFCLLVVVSIALGVIHTQARQDDSQSAQQDNHFVKETFRDVLQGTMKSTEQEGEKLSRQSRITKQLRMTAKSPYLMSHATNLWSVSLFPSPLSALSVGASKHWPDVYRVRGVSLSETIRRSDQVTPTTSVYGPLDMTFVVMAIAPLVVIGLTFNVSSRDRESAMQNLIVAQTPSLGKLMAVRCFVRAMLVVVATVCIVNATLLVVFWSQLDQNVLLNLIIWNVSAALYLFFWAALSFFVNSFAMTSSANGAALLLLWLILVLIIPRVVSKAVQESVSTLPESELVERVQNSIDNASDNMDGLVKRFQSEHPEVEIRLDDEQQMTLLTYLLANSAAGRAAEENVASHYSAQSLRARYLKFCNWVSPAISFRNQSDECSGNSEPSFIAFTVRAAQVHGQVAEVFLHPSVTNQECTDETIEALPGLQELETPKRLYLLNSVQSISSIFVWLISLLCVGIWRFRMKKVN